MPRKARSQKPQRWTGNAHFCAWPRCTELINVSMFMHGEHWRMIPLHLRDALLKAQRQPDEQAIRRATEVITDWARQQAGQMAGAE